MNAASGYECSKEDGNIKVTVIACPLEELPFNPATEWTGVVARGCVGDTLGVFRAVDEAGEECVAFATLPAHLVTSGVTTTTATIITTKKCFTTD